MLAETVVLAASITIVFVRGSLFQPIREHGPKWWRSLAGCTLCSGQWIGMACAAWFGVRDPVTILGAGSATAVLAHVIYQVIDTLVAVELRK